jgi:hypothetical protein
VISRTRQEVERVRHEAVDEPFNLGAVVAMWVDKGAGWKLHFG